MNVLVKIKSQNQVIFYSDRKISTITAGIEEKIDEILYPFSEAFWHLHNQKQTESPSKDQKTGRKIECCLLYYGLRKKV